MKNQMLIFSGKRSKKASLSLSINAIVVLVLAISMLGLGLAFTKSMFKKFGEKLTVPPPDLPATKDEPVVLPSEELEIRHGEEFTFQVNYYNDHVTGKVDAAIICSGSLNNYIASKNMDAGLDYTKKLTSGGASYTAISGMPAYVSSVVTGIQRVNAGTQKSFKFIIPKAATSSLSSELDVCEIAFCAPFTSSADEGTLSYDLIKEKFVCGQTSSSSSTTLSDGEEDSKQITIKVT